MAMNLYHLQVFFAVARRLSYSRAAEELSISQPAVSRHVHALERELGALLFDQIGNRIHLTDAGRIVYQYAQRELALLEETRRALAELEGLERGYLRLGASSTPGTYLLPDVLARFRERHPGVEVSVDIANSQYVVEGVLRNELDLGFVGGVAPVAELHIQPYLADMLVPIVSPSHPFAHRPPRAPGDWGLQIFILREAGSSTRQAMEQGLSEWGVKIERFLELRGNEPVKRVVAAGLGVSFASVYSVTAEVKQGVLRVAGGPELRLPRQLSIVSHKDVRLSVAALAFAALVRKQAPPPLPSILADLIPPAPR